MPTFVYMTRCDGCGHCVDICPSDIMHIDTTYRRAFNIEPNMCWECYSCVKACPQLIPPRVLGSFTRTNALDPSGSRHNVTSSGEGKRQCQTIPLTTTTTSASRCESLSLNPRREPTCARLGAIWQGFNYPISSNRGVSWALSRQIRSFRTKYRALTLKWRLGNRAFNFSD